MIGSFILKGWVLRARFSLSNLEELIVSFDTVAILPDTKYAVYFNMSRPYSKWDRVYFLTCKGIDPLISCFSHMM